MSASLKPYLLSLQHGQDLSQADAAAAMEDIVAGAIDPVQTAAFLMGLRVKGESATEIQGIATVMRRHMIPVSLPVPVLDTCGTGGDGKQTVNISTVVALTCAAMGVPVAKHGNKAVSSTSGSADVLKELAVPTQLQATAAQHYFSQHQFVFLFAPLFHPALKQLASLRQALGVPTVFNILGPLLNPAKPAYQLLGVADARLASVLGQTLISFGALHVVIVQSDDGLDEVSCAASTSVYDFLADGTERRWRIEPAQQFPLADIQVTSAADSARQIQKLAAGQGSAALITTVAMNTGLALYAANRADHYETGRDQAEQFLRTNQLAKYLRSL